MFWRNNYSDISNNTDYFLNKKRTNFTYADSSSYRTVSEMQNPNEPNLMRISIHKTILDSELYESSIQTDDDDMTLRKSSNNKVTISQSNTPNHKKNHSGNSDRVLRSRAYMTSRVNNTSNIPFVREHGEGEIYKYGILNTNTNNSGPDNPLNDKSKKLNVYNYDLSGDEGMGSDTIDSDNALGNFGSNNANSIRPTMQHRGKTKTQWFQRNMFGLPNDESDEVNQNLSGAISGDEQCDVTSYQQLNLNQKSKLSKSQTRKSHRLNQSYSDRKFDNIFCSPMAMINFLVEWIVETTVTVIKHSMRHVKQATYQSTIIRWLMVPFYLPIVLIRKLVAAFAYSSDRLFGTTIRRRLNLNNRSRNILFYIICNIFGLIFLALIVILLLHFFIRDRTTSTETKFLDFFKNFNQFVGNDWMGKNNCCKNNWEQIWRFAFGLFSLPIRRIISYRNSFNVSVSPKIETNNNSNSEILEIFKKLIAAQDEKFFEYNKKLNQLESDLQTKSTSAEFKISEIEKSIESQIQELKSKLNTLNFIQSSPENMNNLNLKYSDLDISRQKLQKNVQALANLIETVEKKSLSNYKSIENLVQLIDKLQMSLNNVQNAIIQIDNKTDTLKLSNEQLVVQSANLKKEILNEVSEEIKDLKESQQNIINNFNEQMSNLEMILNENQSKLSDKDFVEKLLNSHFENLKKHVKDEINVTLWQNFTDHINNLMKATNFKIERNEASNLFLSNNGKSCNCRSPNSCTRNSMTCVRIHQVRQLVKEALNLFAADRIGIPDFALESAGGTIATTRCTETYTDRASTITIFGIPIMRITNSPRTIIQPNTYPGECWPMRGSRGVVVVQLSALIKVTSVSIDHIPKTISPSESIDSAIQDFEIKALSNETDKIGTSLGNFTYLIDSNPVQTFYIQKQMETKFIELIVNSNYGNKYYTCIYRFRVHGQLVQ